MGFNMTLGSCSRYIELCPPPFGYSSKHMESLCCLLPRKLMINAMLPESHHLSCYCPMEFFTNPESAPLQFVSCPHTWPSWMSNQVFVQNQWSLHSDHQDSLVHDRRAIEDLWVVKSYTHITLLPEFWRFLSCCSISEDLISIHQAVSSSRRWILYRYIFFISICSSAVYCSQLHFI